MSMEAAGFSHLSTAPKDILGKPLVLAHWSGATERATFRDVGEAVKAYNSGWVWWKHEVVEGKK